MIVDLSPITHKRLLEFGHRRARLQILRRASIALSIAVLAVMVAVSIDVYHLLTSWQRWALSGLVYSVSVGCIAWLGRTVLTTRDSLSNIARAFEFADPRLREQLLSAVELSSDSECNTASSFSFRARLQQQVAKAIQPVDVAMLLPWQLVRRSLLFGLSVLSLFLALSLIPSLHFPQRIARVFFPAANLARHSRCAIELMRPIPGNQTVAQGDILAVIVRVDGPKPSGVSLQSRSTLAEVLVQTMHQCDDPNARRDESREARSNSHFYQTNLAVDADCIDYRIVAEDASSAWYRIDAVPRPRVIEYEKRMHYPEYTGAADQIHTADHGDVEAISGTIVTLAIRTDPPIASASLDWQSSDSSGQPASSIPFNVIEPLNAVSPNIARCQFPVNADREYRLTVRAAATGFVNSYSPKFNIRALPDSPPRIHWDRESSSSESNRLSTIVRPDFIADLSATLEDEFPVSRLVQSTRVNLRDWVDNSLEIPPDTSANLKWKMDLMPLNLKSGDVVQTKLVAADRKGQISESAVLEMVISSAGFDRHRHRDLQLRRRIADRLHEFATSVSKLASIEKRKLDQLPSHASLEPFALSMREQSAALREKINDVSRQLTDSVSLSELERIGQVLMLIEFETLPKLAHSASAIRDGVARSPEQPELTTTIEQLLDKLSATSKRLDELFNDFHAHDIHAALTHDLIVLVAQQRDLAERVSALSEEQTRREQAVIGRHFREVERLMIEQLPILKDDAARQLEQWSLWFANYAEYIEEGTAEHSSKERVERLAKTVLQQLTQRPPVAAIDSTLPVKLTAGHNEIDERSGTLFHVVDLIGEQLLRQADTNLRDQIKATMDNLLMPMLDQIPTRRQQHLLRSDADRLYASDLGNVHRAVKELLKTGPQSINEAAHGMSEVADAFGVLEAIHESTEAALMLAPLLIGERWEVGSPSARIEHPRLWEAFKQRVDQSGRRLSECGVSESVVAKLRQLLNSHFAEIASQRITSRRWSSDSPTSAVSELEGIEDVLRNTQLELAAIAAQARQTIAKYSPSVSLLAKRASTENLALKTKTDDTAAALAANQISHPGDRKMQLQRDRELIDEPMSDLREALADTAGRMDLLARDDLQKARDADTGVSIVDEAKRRIDGAMQAALEDFANTASSLQKLEKASIEQQRAAEALSRIAEHFEPQDADRRSPPQLAQAQQAWQELARQMNAAEAMQQEYSKAEKLSRLAESDPRNLLKQLEREMNRNIPMQQELSRIARDAAQESIVALQQAAQQERNLNIQMEASDPEYLIHKQLLHSGLMATSERASQIASTLVSEGKSAATQIMQPQPGAQFLSVETRLRQATGAIQSMALESPHDEIQRAAQTLLAKLTESKQQLDGAAESLRKLAQTAAFDSDQELRNRRREMEERLRRVQVLQTRDTVQILHGEEQRLNQAENQLRVAEKSKAPNQRQLDKVDTESAEQTEKAPTRGNRGPQESDSKAVQQHAKKHLELLRAYVETMTARVRRAMDARGQREISRQAPRLNALNPIAEFASLIAKEASEDSADLVGMLTSILNQGAAPDSLQASASFLSQAQQDQQTVEGSVAQVGENLARAARHENRLKNLVAAEGLKQQAERISLTASSEVRAASKALERASEVAKGAPNESSGRANAQVTAASRKAIGLAESSIRERASELESLLAKNSDNGTSEPIDSQEPASDNETQQSSGSPIDSSRMARMLDELDRQLNSRSSANGKSGPPSTSPSPPTPSSSLTEAARQLASDMNRGREAKDTHASQSGNQTSMSRAGSNPAPASQVKILHADRSESGSWGDLRQQPAEQVTESLRESVAPQYRQQVETYFRVLSERSAGLERALPSTAP